MDAEESIESGQIVEKSAIDLESFVDKEAMEEQRLISYHQKQQEKNAFGGIKQFTYGGDHTGFAFAGEEGHVPQITDNLKKNNQDQDA